MSNYKGCSGVVEVGDEVIAEVRDWSLTQTAEVLDASAMGSCDKVKKVGMKDSTGSINCLWDDTDLTGQGVLNGSTGTIVVLKLYPAGDTVGRQFATVSALITSVGTSSSYDGLVETSYDFEGTGPVVWAAVV